MNGRPLSPLGALPLEQKLERGWKQLSVGAPPPNLVSASSESEELPL